MTGFAEQGSRIEKAMQALPGYVNAAWNEHEVCHIAELLTGIIGETVSPQHVWNAHQANKRLRGMIRPLGRPVRQ